MPFPSFFSRFQLFGPGQTNSHEESSSLSPQDVATKPSEPKVDQIGTDQPKMEESNLFVKTDGAGLSHSGEDMKSPSVAPVKRSFKLNKMSYDIERKGTDSVLQLQNMSANRS
jgi:hypothetical protein